jgi:hypothetical protein
MKAINSGQVIGMALESLDSMSGEYARILVFINSHWFAGDIEAMSAQASEPDGEEKGILSQFASAVSSALKEVGIAITDGVATLKEVIAGKVTTQQLCLDDVCVSKTQLQRLLDNALLSPSTPTPTPTPSIDTEVQSPSPTPDSILTITPTPSDTVEPTPSVDVAEQTPTPEPSVTPEPSIEPSTTPEITATPEPTPTPSATPLPSETPAPTPSETPVVVETPIPSELLNI